MNMAQGNHVNGAVMPPPIGRDDADPEGWRVFLRLFDEYANNKREMGGSGAGGVPIQMRCLIDHTSIVFEEIGCKIGNVVTSRITSDLIREGDRQHGIQMESR